VDQGRNLGALAAMMTSYRRKTRRFAPFRSPSSLDVVSPRSPVKHLTIIIRCIMIMGSSHCCCCESQDCLRTKGDSLYCHQSRLLSPQCMVG
jgi:hypothetical protein